MNRGFPMWANDAIFASGDSESVAANASPAFRLCAYFPYEQGHPYVHTEAFEALFSCYKDAIEYACDRVFMYAKPGGKARRSTKIAPADWQPFRALKAEYDDVEHGIFAGFNFIDRRDASAKGGKPFSFRFLTAPVTRLDACVSVEWFLANRLSVETVVAALLSIPNYGFMAGYGLSLSDDYQTSAYTQRPVNLMTVAARYPVLDLHQADMRREAAGITAAKMLATPDNYWIPGVNWITGVGSVFLDALGGVDAVARNLPNDITVSRSPHGAAFTLGAEPIAGDPGDPQPLLDLYRALGRALKPIGYPDSERAPDPVFGWRHQPESLAWVRRFYDSR